MQDNFNYDSIFMVTVQSSMNMESIVDFKKSKD